MSDLTLQCRVSNHDETLAAIARPKAGDRYTAAFEYWVYVVSVKLNTIATIEGVPPCNMRVDGTMNIYKPDQFFNRFAPAKMPWVRLIGRNHDVEWVRNFDGKVKVW